MSDDMPVLEAAPTVDQHELKQQAQAADDVSAVSAATLKDELNLDPASCTHGRAKGDPHPDCFKCLMSAGQAVCVKGFTCWWCEHCNWQFWNNYMSQYRYRYTRLNDDQLIAHNAAMRRAGKQTPHYRAALPKTPRNAASAQALEYRFVAAPAPGADGARSQLQDGSVDDATHVNAPDSHQRPDVAKINAAKESAGVADPPSGGTVDEAAGRHCADDASEASENGGSLDIDANDTDVGAGNLAVDTNDLFGDTSDLAGHSGDLAVDAIHLAIDATDLAIDASDLAVSTDDLSVDAADLDGHAADLAGVEPADVAESSDSDDCTDSLSALSKFGNLRVDVKEVKHSEEADCSDEAIDSVAADSKEAACSDAAVDDAVAAGPRNHIKLENRSSGEHLICREAVV